MKYLPKLELSFFYKIEQAALKIHMKFQGTQNTSNHLEKTEHSGLELNFKMYYKGIIIKIVS